MVSHFLSSALILLAAQMASATLGGKVSSVDHDRQAVRGSIVSKATSSESYTVQEVTADGNSIREYANNDGVIFAVTWNGITHPDLAVLLGPYYTEFKKVENSQERPLSRQPRSFKTTDIVLRRGGHMRDWRGSAYVPNLVPEGVEVENLP